MTDDHSMRAYEFESIRSMIQEFNRKHDLDSESQSLQLAAETGELCEAVNKGDTEEIAEEVGDVIFVAISIADLECVDPMGELIDVTLENMQKDATKDGGKVTKDGLEDAGDAGGGLGCPNCGSSDVRALVPGLFPYIQACGDCLKMYRRSTLEEAKNE